MKVSTIITVLACLLLTVQSAVGQSAETVEKYNAGVAAAKEKDHVAAIKHYSAALSTDPLYPQAYYSRGLSKLQLEDFPGAAKDFKKCTKLEDTNAKAHYYAGYCLMKMTRNEDAIKSFSRALKGDPSLSKVYYYRAKIQMQDENYDKAIADFQDAIVKDEATARVYYQLGVCYLKTAKPDLAKQSFGLAIKADGKYKPAITEKMKLEYKAEDYEKTLSLADQLLTLESDNQKGLYYMAMSFMKQKDLSAAYTVFGTMLEHDPTYVTAMKNRANISLRLKDYTASVSDHTVLIKAEPTSENFYNRALSQMQLEQWPLALSDLNQVVKLDAEFAEAYYNRANVQLQLEKNEEACADMRMAVRLGYDAAMTYVPSLCGN